MKRETARIGQTDICYGINTQVSQTDICYGITTQASQTGCTPPRSRFLRGENGGQGRGHARSDRAVALTAKLRVGSKKQNLWISTWVSQTIPGQPDRSGHPAKTYMVWLTPGGLAIPDRSGHPDQCGGASDASRVARKTHIGIARPRSVWLSRTGLANVGPYPISVWRSPELQSYIYVNWYSQWVVSSIYNSTWWVVGSQWVVDRHGGSDPI